MCLCVCGGGAAKRNWVYFGCADDYGSGPEIPVITLEDGAMQNVRVDVAHSPSFFFARIFSNTADVLDEQIT